VDEVTLKTFILTLSANAADSDLKFLPARNYQGFPENNIGRDIDLLLWTRDIARWKIVLEKTCVQLKLSLRQGVRRFYGHEMYIGGIAGRISELEIDLELNLNWRGIDFLDVDQVINRALHLSGDIWIPHPADECVISFCMSYLHGGFVKEKYLPSMSEQARNDKDEVFRLMSHIFGKKIAEKIVVSLIEKDIHEISTKATKYRIRVLFRGFLRHPLTFIYTFIAGYYLDFKARTRSAKA